ncbi:MAG: tRNA 4-thiouridine(8) synthase ThiI [Syntrophomonas sp.]
MKAISLFSGGLDSQLAALLIKQQGIEVLGMTFCTPFFGASEKTTKSAEQLDIKLYSIDISDDYMKDVLRSPVYGYGKNLNPCIDCHAYMLKRAGQMMEEMGASFLITGEVLGQRPMSQNRSAMSAVEKLAGYRGYIVRPLSAQLLSPTIPENEGWIDRSQLMDISGRSRTRQMELAVKYGIHDYPSPAGGCLLTEANFARRLKKLLDAKPAVELAEIEILKVGRHFILGGGHLLVVGRKHAENERLQQIANPSDYLLKVTDRPGPLGLLRSHEALKKEELEYAASIIARYSDAKNEPLSTVKVFRIDNENNPEIISVVPMSPEKVPATD